MKENLKKIYDELVENTNFYHKLLYNNPNHSNEFYIKSIIREQTLMIVELSKVIWG